MQAGGSLRVWGGVLVSKTGSGGYGVVEGSVSVFEGPSGSELVVFVTFVAKAPFPQQRSTRTANAASGSRAIALPMDVLFG